MRTRSQLYVVLLTAFGASFLLLGFGLALYRDRLRMPEERSAAAAALGLELVDAALQLLAVILIGAAVTYVLGRLEGEREESRRQAEGRRTIVRDVLSSYEAVKSARRHLRALGLRSVPPTGLTALQVEGYHRQMAALNQAQLAFERIKREARAFPFSFTDPKAVVDAAETIEKYLNKLLSEWEDTAALVTVDARPDVMNRMERLWRFIGAPGEGFEEGAAKPLSIIVEGLRIGSGQAT